MNPTPTQLPKSALNEQLGIEKAEFDLIDLIRTFSTLKLQKHDVDKIKTDERIQAANHAIKITQKQLKLGMLIIESILKERMKFIQTMQLNEMNMLQIISDLVLICNVEQADKFQEDLYYEQIKQLKSLIYSQYPLFNQLNQVILNLEQYAMHTHNWKDEISKIAQQNVYLNTLLDMNLIDVANALYHKFKKFKENLSQTYGGVEQENYVLTDEQIQQLLKTLESITEEFKNNSQIHLKIILHNWIEDIVRTQSGFQNNAILFFNQIGRFESTINSNLLMLKNISLRFEEIHYRNLKAQRILKRVVLPQKFENDNLTISTKIEELIQENQQAIVKTKQELQIPSQPIVIIIDVGEPDTVYKPIGQFKGALKLTPKSVIVMEMMLQDKKANLMKYLGQTQSELDAVNQLLEFFKEMLIAEKKLFKAQSLFTSIKASLENSRIGGQQLNLQQIFENSLKLQKYVNYLAEQGQKSAEVADQLPKINDFTGLIQRFTIKAQFLINDVVGIIN